MMKLEVKYRYGWIEFNYYGASRSQVEQVLDKIQDDLRAICGNYRWQLEGEPGRYKIVAYDERGQRFVDAIDKSPGKVLKSFAPARKIIKEKYGIG